MTTPHLENEILQDFPSLDGEPIANGIYDSHIIDNNDFVSFISPTPSKINSSDNEPSIGNFVLMVNGKIISCGNHDNILVEAKSILYGEHPNFDGPVSIENLIILKRIGIKIGVFLDD